VWSWSLDNEEALANSGAVALWKKYSLVRHVTL